MLLWFVTDATFTSEPNINCSEVVQLECAYKTQLCGRPTKDPNVHHSLSKVINGEVAEIEAWPWLVSVNLVSRSLSDTSYMYAVSQVMY